VNLNVGLLVIGALDKSGQISLNSLDMVSGNRICIAANTPGKVWLEKSSTKSVKNRFCFHNEIVEKFSLLDLNAKGSYSPYRTTDFRKLTVLKWDLLSDSILKHNDSDGVIFSDLDILWLKDPKVELEKLLTGKTSMVVQNDSSQARPEWTCTGVMAWLNTTENLHELEMLKNLHLSEISSGHYQDDEDTFNQYITDKNTSLKFNRLSKEGFVVGRNFLNLVFERNGFNQKEMICFHANYLTGLARKTESLQAVKDWTSNRNIPWMETIRFLLFPKYQKLLIRIKRMWFW
jgi:hypothetical protein